MQFRSIRKECSAGEARRSRRSEEKSSTLPRYAATRHRSIVERRGVTRTIRSRWPRQRKRTCTRCRSRCRSSTGSRRSNSRSSNSTSTTMTRRSAARSEKRDAYGVDGDAAHSKPGNCSRENGRSLQRAHDCRLLLSPRARNRLQRRRCPCSSVLSRRASAPRQRLALSAGSNRARSRLRSAPD